MIERFYTIFVRKLYRYFINMSTNSRLVVYYSYENNTKLIAETIAAQIGAEILRIMPKDEMTSHGFFKFVKGGFNAMRKATPELLPIEKNLNDYETIFIGAPVWAGTHAPAMHSFLTQNKIENKKIALFAVCDGGPGHTLVDMKTLLPNNEIIGEKEFIKVLPNREASINLTNEWVNQIIGTR